MNHPISIGVKLMEHSVRYDLTTTDYGTVIFPSKLRVRGASDPNQTGICCVQNSGPIINRQRLIVMVAYHLPMEFPGNN